jgi:ABC-type branched-subunit amino acid transport system substrate-binding protein
VFRTAALALEKFAAEQQWAHAELIPVASQPAAAVIERLRKTAAGSVFCLMPAESAAALIRESRAMDLNPAFLIPGSLVTGKSLDAIRESNAKAWLAFSELPEDASGAAVEEYRALAGIYSLPATHVPVQWAAISGAKLLIEALQKAGRDVTRQSLISTLESFRQIRTGLLPPITFGPNRHVGIVDAHIVAIDPASGKLVLAGKSP